MENGNFHFALNSFANTGSNALEWAKNREENEDGFASWEPQGDLK